MNRITNPGDNAGAGDSTNGGGNTTPNPGGENTNGTQGTQPVTNPSEISNPGTTPDPAKAGEGADAGKGSGEGEWKPEMGFDKHPRWQQREEEWNKKLEEERENVRLETEKALLERLQGGKQQPEGKGSEPDQYGTLFEGLEEDFFKFDNVDPETGRYKSMGDMMKDFIANFVRFSDFQTNQVETQKTQAVQAYRTALSEAKKGFGEDAEMGKEFDTWIAGQGKAHKERTGQNLPSEMISTLAEVFKTNVYQKKDPSENIKENLEGADIVANGGKSGQSASDDFIPATVIGNRSMKDLIKLK